MSNYRSVLTLVINRRNRFVTQSTYRLGGWLGHQPKEVAESFVRILKEEGFETEVSDTLDAFKDEAKLKGLSLIVPVWTMGKISAEQANPVFNAVKSGVGIAGCHGGMCDSFPRTHRMAIHDRRPVGGSSRQRRRQIPREDGTIKSPITEGIKDFDVASEQYYLHVDPAVKVLATTEFPVADGPHVGNGKFNMPVLWTKVYGAGRVFYSSWPSGGHCRDGAAPHDYAPRI